MARLEWKWYGVARAAKATVAPPVHQRGFRTVAMLRRSHRLHPSPHKHAHRGLAAAKLRKEKNPADSAVSLSWKAVFSLALESQ
ncbi:hypothetical protein NL676_033279 [Syzygium grande]|nr:hypothetical protein NL676_033279 [Syzygium grande]